MVTLSGGVRQRRETPHNSPYINMWDLKGNDTNELTNKTVTHREQIYICRRGGWGRGIVREFGMDVCTLLHLKWISNKDLLYSTGNLVYVIWQPGREGHLGENGCVCG